MLIFLNKHLDNIIQSFSKVEGAQLLLSRDAGYYV